MITKPTTHSATSYGTLCGSNSMAAQWRAADCKRCGDRMDVLMELLFDAAVGQDVKARAASVIKKWRLTKGDDTASQKS